MLQTTRVIANLVDVNLSLFNLPTSLSYHYPRLSLTVAPSWAWDFVSSLIQLQQQNAARLPLNDGRRHSERTGDCEETIKDFPFFSPPLIRPQHIGHLSLPSLSTWLNIVTALMNYASPSESHSLVLVSFTPSASQMCVFQLQGHLKASGFNKTVIKGNMLFLLSLCLLWSDVVDLPFCWMTQTSTEAQISSSSQLGAFLPLNAS